MRTPTWRFSIRGALGVIALLSLVAAGARLLLFDPPPLSEGERLAVPANVGLSTLIGTDTRTPPPWPRGNQFWLSRLPWWRRAVRRNASPRDHAYQVVNMHRENFEEIVRQLGLKAVEVEYSGGYFLVVDPRVPREWLLDSTRTRLPDEFLAKHADKFRAPDTRQ